jgi:hypothetical protein
MEGGRIVVVFLFELNTSFSFSHNISLMYSAVLMSGRSSKGLML